MLSVSMRGIELSNLNVTIDGARQGRNLHQHRGNIGGIDPYLLKQVQVQAGPGAESGPGALGGSIRFETVDAQDLLNEGRNIGATLRTGYSSADKAPSGAATVYGLATDKLGLLAQISAVNTKNYRMGDGGRVANSAGKDRNYFFKASLIDLNGHSLRLSAEKNTNSGLYLWGSVGSDMGYAPEGSVPVYQETERETYTLTHTYRSDNNPWLDWKFNLYANKSELRHVDANTEISSDEIGGSAQNTFRFKLGQTVHQLTLGGDWFNEKLESPNTIFANRPSDLLYGVSSPLSENKSSNQGLFIQERMSIGPVHLSAGLRYDHFKSEYGPHEFSGNEISPNAGIEWDIGAGFTAFASYGEAIRGSGLIPGSWMANITAQTVFNNGQPLEPEKSRMREAGLRYSGGNLFADNDAFQIGVTIFKQYLYNTIERVGGGGGPVTAIRNHPDTLISKGWELRTSYALGGYQTSLAYSRVDSEDQNGNPAGINRRRNAPTGDRIVWDNRWQVNDTFTLGYTLNAVSRLKDVPAGQLQRPGYVLHDVQLQWQPEQIKGLALDIALRNLTDKRYSSQTSIAAGYDNILHEPGRSLHLNTSYRF